MWRALLRPLWRNWLLFLMIWMPLEDCEERNDILIFVIFNFLLQKTRDTKKVEISIMNF